MSPDSKKSAQEMAKGRAFLGHGEYTKALSSFDRALEMDPENVAANLEAGTAAFALAHRHLVEGDETRALDCSKQSARYFARAAELDPTSTEAQVGWGRALVGLGRTEQALWRFDRALELDTKEIGPLLEAGDALLAAARTESPASRRHAFERAEARFDLAVAADAGSAKAWLGLGRARAGQRYFEGALEAFEESKQKDGSLLDARVGIGQMANSLERFEAARDAFEQVVTAAGRGDGNLSLELTIDAYLGLVTALSRLRQWDTAREALTGLSDLAERLPENVPGMSALQERVMGLVRVLDSIVLSELGCIEEAVASADEAAAAGGYAVFRALMMLTALHATRGAYDRSAATLLEAEKRLAEIPEHEDRIGMALLASEVRYARGRPKEACESLEEECRREPEDLDLQMSLIRLIAREKSRTRGNERDEWGYRLMRAVRRAKQVLEPRSDRASAKLSYGALEVLSGNATKARELLLEAVEQDPESDEGHGLLGAAHAVLGDYGEAAQSFAAASRLAQANFSYRLGLAAAYARLGNVDNAERLYRDILAKAPANVEALVGLGAVLGSREDADSVCFADAEASLREALRVAATMNGDLAGQIASLRLSAAQRAEIYYQLGLTRIRRCEVEQRSVPARRARELLRGARTAFARALREDPGMFRARRGIARVETQQRARTEEKPPWPLLAAIATLLALMTSSFVFQLPKVEELTGEAYTAVALGLLGLLMAALYLPQLRSLSVAGMSMEKDVEMIEFTSTLGIEDNPGFIDLIPPDIGLPPAPEPAGSRPDRRQPKSQAQLGWTPDTGEQATEGAEKGRLALPDPRSRRRP